MTFLFSLDKDDTWEPITNLPGSEHMIDEFQKHWEDLPLNFGESTYLHDFMMEVSKGSYKKELVTSPCVV